MKKFILSLCVLTIANNSSAMQYLARAGRFLRNRTHQETKSLIKNTFSHQKNNLWGKIPLNDIMSLIPYGVGAAKPLVNGITDSLDVLSDDNEIGPEAWKAYYKTNSYRQFRKRTIQKNIYHKKMWTSIAHGVAQVGKSFALNLACSKIEKKLTEKLGINNNKIAHLLIHSTLKTGFYALEELKIPTLIDYGRNILLEGFAWQDFSHNKNLLYATIGRSALLGAITHGSLFAANTALAHSKYQRIQRIIEGRLENREYIPINIHKQNQFVALCNRIIKQKIQKNTGIKKQAFENYLFSYIKQLLIKEIEGNQEAQKYAVETLKKINLNKYPHILTRIFKLAIKNNLTEIVTGMTKNYSNLFINTDNYIENRRALPINLSKKEKFIALCNKIVKEKIQTSTGARKIAFEKYLLSYIQQLLTKELKNDELGQNKAFEILKKINITNNQNVLSQILKIAIMRELWLVVDNLLTAYNIHGSISTGLSGGAFEVLLEILHNNNMLTKPKVTSKNICNVENSLVFEAGIVIKKQLVIKITTHYPASTYSSYRTTVKNYISFVYNKIVNDSILLNSLKQSQIMQQQQQQQQQQQNKGIWSSALGYIKSFI